MMTNVLFLFKQDYTTPPPLHPPGDPQGKKVARHETTSGRCSSV